MSHITVTTPRLQRQPACIISDARRAVYTLLIRGWPKDPRLKQVKQYSCPFMDQSLDGWALLPIGEILNESTLKPRRRGERNARAFTKYPALNVLSSLRVSRATVRGQGNLGLL
ncbi:hypothetical protein LZ30DRAFT_822099 [Colletotrichum cereale]|nr:hypothetical protein LZ30DRAFT_822099 [Colletotrichum cereale]